MQARDFAHFFTPNLEFGGVRPMFSLENRELEALSAMEYQSFNNPSAPKVVLPMASDNFKTQLCQRFKWGNCTFGDRCRFAHGIGDIRRPLSHCQGTVNRHECVHLNKHSLPPVFPNKNNREKWAISNDTTCSKGYHISGSTRLGVNRSVSRNFEGDRLSPRPVIFKTKLCHKWVRTRNCPYGNNCRYAHGYTEIQKLRGYSALELGILQTTNPKTCDAAKSTSSIGRTGLELQELKCMRNELGRMSRIYADWLQDVPLLHA
ncbi:hypothetical protein FNV43_RR06936 [Rhamnella rubrinervis]|uniref:C3H1-type domain-containing protein n=1 Tax=Rhamnella rubrinervis TaxID=2594499 RepID=A0A8K0MLX0_9ROSA|nr:hypothetical protein FNV43_RR06936 [Rhamnella rubrinervis]